MLVPLDIPPGVSRNGTDYQNAQRWRDANLVRWQDRAMLPVGGWAQRGTVDVAGTPRAMRAWRDLENNRWLAIGCHDKLFVMSSGNTVSDITPTNFTAGRSDAGVITGYGGGPYGQGLYGQSKTGTIVQPATMWHLDTFGENLIGCTAEDGQIYEWKPETTVPAAPIENAPTRNLGCVVTQERFLFALGADRDPRKVAWSDQENNTVWSAQATNQAGDFLIETTGRIQVGVKVRGQTLILTTEDAHVAEYIGPPLVYGFERVGTNCGAVSRGAVASVAQGAVWMGERGFFRYFGGAVEEIPCEVSDFVFSNLNREQKSKIVAVNNAAWGEVWWFYPTSAENDRYVCYDTRENIWMTGEIDRTAGVDTGVFEYPIWSDADGVLYEHEKGTSHGALTPYAETGPISQGERITLGRLLYPDEATQGQVTATFKTRFFPNGAETSHGPYTLVNPTGVRFAGRQFRLRVQGTGANWRWGIPQLEVGQGGRR